MNFLKRILLLALIVRILIMPFMFHPDIRVYHSQAQYFKEGVINIYPFLEKSKDSRHYKEEFVYFPAAYLFLGSYQALVDPLLGDGFDDWLNGEDSISLYRYLFILKLPYLFLDIGIALLIFKLVSKKYRKIAFILWLFNPFSILLIYAYSNIDILPVFMTIIALLFLKNNKGLHAGISLVLGAAFKAYPLILLPSLLFTQEKERKKIINVLLSLAVFAALILPFWGESFIHSAFSSGLTNRLFEFGIDVGLPRKIPYFLIFYILVFVYHYFSKLQKYELFMFSILVMLVASVDYHVQWLIWFIPFFVLLATKKKELVYMFIVLMILAFVPTLLLNDKFQSVGLYAPISPIFTQASSPYLFLQNILDPILARELAKDIFLIFSLFIVTWTTKYEVKSN